MSYLTTRPGRTRGPARRAAGRGAALFVTATLLAAASCSGGSSPAGPEDIDIGRNRAGVGWAFGDSLSHGRDSLFSYQLQPLNDAGPDEPGYRLRLEQLFAKSGRTVNVVEDGEPASFSADGVARIWRAVAGRPAFLVLLYGTNDAYLGLPVGQLESNLRYIVDECRKNKIIVVLCTLPPICEVGAVSPRIDAYNSMIRSMAPGLEKRWGAVLLADLDKAFRLRGRGDVCRLLNPLGVHPTKEGYELMGDTVFESLKAVTW